MSGTLTAQSLQFIDGLNPVYSGPPITVMNDGGNAIATDSVGNVYVTGYITGPSIGTTTIPPTSVSFAGVPFNIPNVNDEAMYIGKIDQNGAPIWLRTLNVTSATTANTRGQSISVDNAGNVYITGYSRMNVAVNNIRFGICQNTLAVPAEPAPSNQIYTKPLATVMNTNFLVLLKIDTSGNFGWLRTLDGTGSELGSSISTNTSNVYFTGVSDTAGLILNYTLWDILGSGSPSTQPWTKPATTTGESVIIGQVNPTGALTWLKLLDGIGGNQRGNGIAVENSGDVLITGGTDTTGTSMDFITCYFGAPPTPPNPLPLTKVSTTGNSLFLLKLDSGGGFTWMKILDSALSDGGDAVTIRYEVPIKIYIAGSTKAENTILYSEVVSGSPSLPQTWNIPMTGSPTGLACALAARIDFSSGDLDWLSFLCSTSANASTGIAVSTQDVYVSGIYALSGSVQFGKASQGTPADPLIPILGPTVPSIDGGYILKLDTSGNYAEFKRIYVNTGPNNYRINGITVDVFNDIYIIGDTNQTSNIPLINFADQTFTKPTTQGESAFVGKLKNLSLFPPINPICYAKGTLIGTDRGFVPIEDIRLSDKVRTYDRIEENMFRPVHGVPVKTLTRVEDTRLKNRFAKIKFIGHFTVDAMNGDTAPICITAGALGENKPERDLFVSPNHSMLIGDRLIFAKDMVNEISIYQDMSFETIEYYHILCDDHYIINANGAMSETLGTEELKLFETMIYAQSKVYEPLALENKYHLQDIAT
jgi:hypothetical protein